MRFVKLEAENFKSFKELTIDLDGHGFVKIDGVNNTDSYSGSVGSGKSTIADAISYALTGETVKGNSSMSDVKNLYTDGECRVMLTFEHSNHTYVIGRGDGLYISEDGVNISKHLKRETQQLIQDMFPMFTPTFIGATVIIGQNMPNSFTNNKPSARKQILEELTNSSFMIEEIKQRLSDKKNEWQSELGDLQTKMTVLQTKKSSAEKAISTAKVKMSHLRSEDEINESIEQLSTQEEDYKTSLEKGRSDLSEVEEEQARLSEIVGEVNKSLLEETSRHSDWLLLATKDMMKERSEIQSELSSVRATFQAKQSEAKRLKATIQELQNAPTICPTCKQPLPDAHKIDTTAQEEELGALLQLLETLKSKGIELSEKDEELDNKISSFNQQNGTNETLETLKKALQEHEQQQGELRKKISFIKQSIREDEMNLQSVRSDVEVLKRDLQEVGALRKSLEETIRDSSSEIDVADGELVKLKDLFDKRSERLTTLNQVISFATRDFRTILLSSIIKRLDAYAKAYCKKMLDTTEIEFKDDGNNIAITFRGRDFGVLSGGESQIVKMCVTLALKKTLEDLVGFTTNIMFFDEILDNCDKSTAQQIIELVSGLELGSTFFISHHEDVYLPVDQTWTVTKTDRISTLTV